MTFCIVSNVVGTFLYTYFVPGHPEHVVQIFNDRITLTDYNAILYIRHMCSLRKAFKKLSQVQDSDI